jgi:chemotaxis response regulator CheB
MPRAAIERGAAEYVEDLPGVAKRLVELLGG